MQRSPTRRTKKQRTINNPKTSGQAGGFRLLKKPRRVRRYSGESNSIIFCGGMYVTKNTLQDANVRVKCRRHLASAMQRPAMFFREEELCRKTKFFDSLKCCTEQLRLVQHFYAMLPMQSFASAAHICGFTSAVPWTEPGGSFRSGSPSGHHIRCRWFRLRPCR